MLGYSLRGLVLRFIIVIIIIEPPTRGRTRARGVSPTTMPKPCLQAVLLMTERKADQDTPIDFLKRPQKRKERKRRREGLPNE